MPASCSRQHDVEGTCQLVRLGSTQPIVLRIGQVRHRVGLVPDLVDTPLGCYNGPVLCRDLRIS